MYGLPVSGDSTFWTQFWPNLVATLVGAFVGIWLALKADHVREQRARGAQEAALLQAARNTVKANLELCDQLKKIIPQELVVPTFMMDVGLLDAILPRLVELSLDVRLVEELGNFRYQLHHINRKLDHLLEVVRAQDASYARSYVGGLSQVGGTIMGTLAALEGSGLQTLPPLLEARLTTLEQPARGLRRLL